METKTLQKIINREKTIIRVYGYTYRVVMNKDAVSVCLLPFGDSDVARSELTREQYEFTHGGKIFRRAVEIAQEIAHAIVRDQAAQT